MAFEVVRVEGDEILTTAGSVEEVVRGSRMVVAIGDSKKRRIIYF